MRQSLLFTILFLTLQSSNAQSLLCKNLFHIELHENTEVQNLYQEALSISEKMAQTPVTFFSIPERLLKIELRSTHKKILRRFSTPPQHPGALVVRGFFLPEFFWPTTVSSLTGGIQTRTPFLTSQQRDDLHFAMTPNGVVQTRSGESLQKAIYGDFVIGLDQKIYVAHDLSQLPSFFRHSSFFAGAPVLFAGYIRIEPNGFVSSLSRQSGHYQPSKAHLHWTIEFLRESGFTTLDSYPDLFDE